MKFKDFTPNERNIIAEFVYSYDAVVLIKDDALKLLDIMYEKKMIDKEDFETFKIRTLKKCLMKLQEEIKQLAETEYGTEIGSIRGSNPYDLEADRKNGYIKGYTQCQQDMKPLLEDLFSLWQSLAEVGEISVGKNFTKKYEELKNSLNKQD